MRSMLNLLVRRKRGGAHSAQVTRNPASPRPSMDEINMETLCAHYREKMLKMAKGQVRDANLNERAKSCRGCALLCSLVLLYELHWFKVAICLVESQRQLVVKNEYSRSILFVSGMPGQQNPWNLSPPTVASSVLAVRDNFALTAARIERWVRICGSDHQSSFGQPDQASVLPTRILDVGTLARPFVYLREPQNVLGQYICLSYAEAKVHSSKQLLSMLHCIKSAFRSKPCHQPFVKQFSSPAHSGYDKSGSMPCVYYKTMLLTGLRRLQEWQMYTPSAF